MIGNRCPTDMLTRKLEKTDDGDKAGDGPSKRLKGVIKDPDHLKCPICLEFFKDEIYQCLNGHSICHKCFENLTPKVCPNCRQLYSSGKIRNHLVENILSNLQFDCVWKGHGCPQRQLKLEEWTPHKELCTFNPSPLKLCEQLYDGNCPYEVSREFLRGPTVEIPREYVEHLKNAHNASTLTQNLNQKLFITYSIAGLTQQPNLISCARSILQLKDNQRNTIGVFALSCIAVADTSEISWCAVRLTEYLQAKKVAVVFSLTSSISTESDVVSAKKQPRPDVSWNGPILSLSQFEELRQARVGNFRETCNKMLNFSMPVSHLQKYYLNVEEKLTIELKFIVPSNDWAVE